MTQSRKRAPKVNGYANRSSENRLIASRESSQSLIPLHEETPEALELIARKEALKDHYRRSLYATVKDLCGYNQVNWRTHGSIIEALEAPTERKLIVVPRGCFKSTIGVVGYTVWTLIKNPDARILIDSELYSNSSNFIREIKGILESEFVTDLFGTFNSKELWSSDGLIIRQRSRPWKEASVTCGGVGTVKVGQHYTHIIGDDYNSPKNSSTPEQRAKIVRHYRYNLSILEPNGVYVLIGTRYSEGDLIGHVIREELELNDTGNLGLEGCR